MFGVSAGPEPHGQITQTAAPCKRVKGKELQQRVWADMKVKLDAIRLGCTSLANSAKDFDINLNSQPQVMIRMTQPQGEQMIVLSRYPGTPRYRNNLAFRVLLFIPLPPLELLPALKSSHLSEWFQLVARVSSDLAILASPFSLGESRRLKTFIAHNLRLS